MKIAFEENAFESFMSLAFDENGKANFPTRICFGSKPEWATMPINNLPANTLKVRRKIRYCECARAYVKTTTEVQEWYLSPNGDGKTLNLVMMQGSNVR